MSSENKRFYWIKLNMDFFNQETIDWLKDQDNGCEYIVLYLQLCLLTANTSGELIRTIGDMTIPYNPKKISQITGFDIDTVNVALSLFRHLGLVEENQEGIQTLPEVKNMVGSESASAARVRKHRKKKKEAQKALQSNTNVTDGVLQSNVEYRDKSIEIRDKSINNNISCSNAQQTDSHLSGKTEQDESLVVQKADDRKAKSPCPSMTPEEKDTLFNRFWQAYPRKVGKGSAQKVFDRLQVDRPLLEEMLCKIDQAKRSRQWQDMQYIPYPATWLNGRRWEDELPAENKRPAKEVNFDANAGTADSAADASPWRRGLIG